MATSWAAATKSSRVSRSRSLQQFPLRRLSPAAPTALLRLHRDLSLSSARSHAGHSCSSSCARSLSTSPYSCATAAASRQDRPRGETWWEMAAEDAQGAGTAAFAMQYGGASASTAAATLSLAGTAPQPFAHPSHPFYDRLTQQMQRFVSKTAASPQHESEKDEFLVKLAKILESVVGDNAKVQPFGSVVNGFWSPTSDIDICIHVPAGASTRAAQTKILKRIGNELARVSSHFIEPRFGAKVPIVHWAPRKKGMLACDISVNNVLAVVNSKLIHAYVNAEPRLHAVGMCLKAWASARGINDRSRGTLSSFSLILMLVHYLQTRWSLLPSLQDLAIQRSYPPVYVQGVDCRFCTNAAEIKDEILFLQEKHADALRERLFSPRGGPTVGGPFASSMAAESGTDERGDADASEALEGQGHSARPRETSAGNYEILSPPTSTTNTASSAVSSNLARLSPGFLLADFFRYFAHEYKAGVVAVRDISGTSAFQSMNGSKYLHIDNPFEVGKDVANVEVALMRQIQRELSRAADILRAPAGGGEGDWVGGGLACSGGGEEGGVLEALLLSWDEEHADPW